MDDLWRTLSFGIGRKNPEPVDHELFDDDPAWDIPEAAALRDLARSQLGTIGSGNHFVDLFVDELGRVWVGVHFGSRGLGHKLATHFIKAGGGTDGMHVDPVVLDADSDLGREYLACMHMAGRYAYAGRDWVCARVARLLGARIVEEVHNHHNFAWRERHFGQDLWVVRKGATPAFPGQRGFVGGTMGDISVIIEGLDGPESELALRSTIHGAGRVMSRTQAAGKSRFKRGRRIQLTEGKISRKMMQTVAGPARRGAARRRHRRVPALLQADRGGAALPRRHHPRRARAGADRRRDGRAGRDRPLSRLTHREAPCAFATSRFPYSRSTRSHR